MDRKVKKNILHFITTLNDGGAEGALYRLIVNDDNNVHTVVTFVPDGKYERLLIDAGVNVVAVCINFDLSGISAFLRLRSIVKSVNPDIVQTWMYHADLIGGLAAFTSSNCPIVWCIRHTELIKGQTKMATRSIFWVNALLSYIVPSKIIVCANASIIYHSKKLYNKEKMVLIHNGYDLSKFDIDNLSGINFRIEHGIKRDSVCIGNVSRYHPYKDHLTLIKAAEKLKESGLEFRLVLIGSGLTKDNTNLIGLLKRHNVYNLTHLIGPTTNVAKAMNSFEVFVLSSVTEGFPNVLCEAMACGVECVSTDVGDARCIIEDSDKITKIQDPVELSEAIHKVVSFKPDNNRRAMLREKIVKKYSIDKMVEKYDAVWCSFKK